MNRKFFMVLFIVLVTLFLPIVRAESQPAETNNQVQSLQEKVDELTKRLKRLEPDKPRNFYQSDFQHLDLPKVIYPVKDVIQSGKELHYEIGLDDRNWERPVYNKNWHSTFWGGRWSYVPGNLYDTTHRIFIGFQSAGIWFGLINSLGLEEELKNVSFPETKVNEKAVFVIMQADVKKIINKGNQIVIISEPKRSGLQVLAIKNSDLLPLNPKEAYLIQLVTPDGYEYDYKVDPLYNVLR